MLIHVFMYITFGISGTPCQPLMFVTKCLSTIHRTLLYKLFWMMMLD